MYLAIVFLPLLGAVIAGSITLVGARNRLPGEDPPPHLTVGQVEVDAYLVAVIVLFYLFTRDYR